MKKQIINLMCITLTAITLIGCGSSETGNTSSVGSGGRTPNKSYNAGISADQVDGFSVNSSYSSESASNNYSYDYEDTALESVPEEEPNTTETHEADISFSEEKLVYTCDMSIETLDYQDTIDKIYSLIETYEGIIQSTYEYDDAYDWYYEDYAKTSGTLNCRLNIRVPSKNYKAITESLGNVGKVKSKQSSVDNISQQYYDTSTRIKALEKEENRLLQMMDTASTIEDMIDVEQRLSEVESELMQLKTDIKYMDMDVAYSYINLNIKEVMEYSEDIQPVKTKTFLDRLQNQLENTWKTLLNNLEGLLFLVIGLMPYIIIAVVIIIVYKKLLKNKIQAIKEKREAKRKESGDLSLKDMSKMINDLNKQIKDKEESNNK